MHHRGRPHFNSVSNLEKGSNSLMDPSSKIRAPLNDISRCIYYIYLSNEYVQRNDDA